MISAVIPARDRAHTLRQVLPSYLAHNDIHEIIVVDDASALPLEEALTEVSDQRVRFVRLPTQCGLPGARNRGVREASGEFVLFGEDDVELHPAFVARLLDGMECHAADIVVGRLLLQRSGETMQQAVDRARANEASPGPRLHGPVLFDTARFAHDEQLPFAHAIMLGRRETFLHYPFDEELLPPSYQREDHDMQLRAVRDGLRLWLIADAFVLHLHKAATEGGGGRPKGIPLARLFSVCANTWKVVDRHRDAIADAFPNLPAQTLAARSAAWMGLIDVKRQLVGQLNPFLERLSKGRRD